MVVPVPGEARNMRRVFARIPPDVHEAVLVDGLSVDGTVDADGSNGPGEIARFAKAAPTSPRGVHSLTAQAAPI
jgi:hypothetical protein